MAPQAAAADAAAITVRLSKNHASIIWPGLNYLVCQGAGWEQTGQSLTCHPLANQPLSPGSDLGAFSAPMMQRVNRLWDKIKPLRTTGGQISVDEIDLRAALFAARTSVKLQRHLLRKAQKKGAAAQRRLAQAKRAIQKAALGKERAVKFLEKERKRASRAFQAAAGGDELRAQAEEWRAHLRWMEFHLAYFKPPPRPGAGRLQWRRLWLQTLRQIAEQAILEAGYQLPDGAALERTLRLYLNYSLRGRMGEFNHIYMTNHSSSWDARLRMLDFVQQRLVLEVAS